MNEHPDPTLRKNTGPTEETVVTQKSDEFGLQPGMVLKDRFELESVLGRGGMGTIFKAIDRLKQEMDDRKPYVAIKVLHPNYQNDANLVRALQREARKSQELSHPHIVNVHDFDRSGRFVYMVMEFLSGFPLDVLVENGTLSGKTCEQRWAMIEQIARGLAYAHEKKVIHYDIKPANIFVCDDGDIKILDFGIARAMRSSSPKDMTVFDQFTPAALTPAYASCEMLCGETPDIRDDLYALGCVAYEVLSGQHPFRRMPALQACAEKMHPDPIEGIPKNRWKAIESCLQFRRDERTGSVAEFLQSASPEIRHPPYRVLAVSGVVGGMALVGAAVYYFVSPPAEPDPRTNTKATTPATWTATNSRQTEDLGPAEEFAKLRPQDLSAERPARPKPAAELASRAGQPVQPAKPLTPQQKEKIARLLDIAAMHMAVKREVEPVGSSALDAYRSVLEIDPSSEAAREGINQAVRACETTVRDYMESGDTEYANHLAQRCLEARPSNKVLRRVYEQTAGNSG